MILRNSKGKQSHQSRGLKPMKKCVTHDVLNQEHLSCRMFTSVVWESKRGVQIAQELALDLETRSMTHPYPQATRARWSSCRKVTGAARWDVENKTQPSRPGRDAGILGREDAHSACIWGPSGQGWWTLVDPGGPWAPSRALTLPPGSANHGSGNGRGNQGHPSWRLAVTTEKVVVWYGFSFSLKEGMQWKNGKWKSKSEENHRNEKRERRGVGKKKNRVRWCRKSPGSLGERRGRGCVGRRWAPWNTAGRGGEHWVRTPQVYI